MPRSADTYTRPDPEESIKGPIDKYQRDIKEKKQAESKVLERDVASQALIANLK